MTDKELQRLLMLNEKKQKRKEDRDNMLLKNAPFDMIWNTFSNSNYKLNHYGSRAKRKHY